MTREYKTSEHQRKYAKQYSMAHPEVTKKALKRRAEKVKRLRAEDPKFDYEFRKKGREAFRRWWLDNKDIHSVRCTLSREKRKKHVENVNGI